MKGGTQGFPRHEVSDKQEVLFEDVSPSTAFLLTNWKCRRWRNVFEQNFLFVAHFVSGKLLCPALHNKPNFGLIRRFRTTTGLEIENWIEKCGQTVRKFWSTWPRTESNFRFGLTSCRSQNMPSEVRHSCQVFDSFSLVTSSSWHYVSDLQGFIQSLTRPNWSFV